MDGLLSHEVSSESGIGGSRSWMQLSEPLISDKISAEFVCHVCQKETEV